MTTSSSNDPTRALKSDTPPVRIMLIDDEPAVANVLKIQLQRLGGFTVFIDNDSRNAVKSAKCFGPEIIFCDVDMPHRDGGAVAADLKAGLARPVPLVFLTSLVTPDQAGDGNLLGGYPFLAKPVKIADVKNCIARILDRAP